MSAREQEDRFSIDPDADWEKRWNGLVGRGESKSGDATRPGEGPADPELDDGACTDECECERARRRLELREWKMDINPNRRRGVSAPSARSPEGLDGLAGLRDPGEPRVADGACGVTTRTVGRGEVVSGLDRVAEPGGESVEPSTGEEDTGTGAVDVVMARGGPVNAGFVKGGNGTLS